MNIIYTKKLNVTQLLSEFSKINPIIPSLVRIIDSKKMMSIS